MPQPRRAWMLWLLPWIIALAACGGDDGEDEQSSPLPGRMAFVQQVSGRDVLRLAEDSHSRRPRNLSISSVVVQPAHEAGTQNLQPSQILQMGLPVWHPAGESIALIVSRSDVQSQIIVVNATTGVATTASLQTGRVGRPRWSADGRYLAYTQSGPGGDDWRLVAAEVASGALREYRGTVGMRLSAWQWSADGNAIDLIVAHPTTGRDTLQSIDVASESVTNFGEARIGVARIIDLWRSQEALAEGYDPEYRSLGVRFLPQGVDGRAVLFNNGPIVGWFLNSVDLVALEIYGGGVRQAAWVAKFNPNLPAGAMPYELFPVSTPVPGKWSFQPEQ